MAKTTSKIIALALTGVCASTSANAAGWQLNDFSVAGLGRAYAGGGVVGDDYSALAYNPAGMTLGGTGVQAGISVIQLHADVTGEYASGSLAGKRDSTNVNVTTEVPNFFAQYKVNDRVAVGFGVYVPFGLAIEYPKDWIGTDHGIDSELAVIDYSTAVAVKATDKLSLGLGIFARNANVDLTSSTTLPTGKVENEFDLDDWGWGLHVGAMYEFTKNTRLGVSYRSRSQHKIKGDFDYLKASPLPYPYAEGSTNATLPMDAPEQVQLSGYHKLNDKIGLSAGAKWTRWTRFDALVINNSFKSVEVAQRWKNAWNFSLGMDYYHSENWTFRTGIGFDESPVPNSYERTTAIADNDRWEIALGASYKQNAWTFDMGYMFLYLPHYSVHNNRHDLNNNPSVAQIDARYHTTAHVLGLQVQYSFDATP